ncbi:TadE family protein [Gulosibacter molinativorax]|uniref:Pilus assembly protein n=1 Tax=Gulosibacter molinativorax TaxID=256821 RepID=A0ABT7CB35_9MICO|nr:TadE family protein [Gulosibacter molinativorax]MDJ1372370.1 pilus assembly protein [Gulosibacter molinativorax]QUY63541.1 Hypotetical protein [Gulosibacter molinativorax]
MIPRWVWRARSERGGAAAEFAVAIPAVVLVLTLCVGAVVSASAYVRVQDAAGEAARLSARGDAPDSALSIAGSGASVDTWDSGEFRCARVSAPITIAGITVSVSAEGTSCALRDTR